MLQVELTYKARDVEEFLDIYFYRPFGFLIAKVSQRFGIKPNAITLAGMIIGIAAGHLFFYNNISITLYGILLLIISETLDSADGQLARLTNFKSKNGRIFDGFASNLVFLSIYTHLCLRIIMSGGPIWIPVVAVVSGICHSYQSAMADYYRNGYLHFVISVKKGEIGKSGELIKKFKSLSWKNDFASKCLTALYINYTRQQESLSENFQKLLRETTAIYGENIPDSFKNRYRGLNKPLLKYYNILTTNTRMIFLFIVLLIDKPYFYFWFELTVLNFLLVFVIIKQEKINKMLLSQVIKKKSEPVNEVK
ncbi:MAG: CDP-alcohol phosphatidyltransferase family protein [Ignavibacteriales bacterium]